MGEPGEAVFMQVDVFSPPKPKWPPWCLRRATLNCWCEFQVFKLGFLELLTGQACSLGKSYTWEGGAGNSGSRDRLFRPRDLQPQLDMPSASKLREKMRA